MKSLAALVAAASLAVLASPCGAQGFGERRMGPPAFLKQLFLPATVMQHQREIGLTDAQREAITREMAAAQQKLLQLRWQLEEKSEALDKLLATDRVDEKAALERAGEILDVERQMKQAHLELLVRIKNQLSPEQQEKLRALRPHEGLFGFRHRGGEGAPPAAGSD
jgi:Spy/CpxP family protein refolding chaperone